ncbi:hypothetical protein BS732_1153 [Bacillus subtilis MB73/2]|nr:hypothetical protein BS732_1153 [Bacillus subtilis MB73/2]
MKKRNFKEKRVSHTLFSLYESINRLHSYEFGLNNTVMVRSY